VRALLLLACCTPAQTPVVEVRAPQPIITERSVTESEPAPVARQPIEIETPFRVGQSWFGHYACAQGETDLVINIASVDSSGMVGAIFTFDHIPTNAHGAYTMDGRYDVRTHSISFSPSEWVERPPKYMMVGLTGTVTRRSFSGKIDHPSCGAFSVSLD